MDKYTTEYSQEKIDALSEYLDTEVEQIDANTFKAGDAEYLVLTAEESNTKAIEECTYILDELGAEGLSKDYVKVIVTDPSVYKMDAVNELIENEIEYFTEVEPDEKEVEALRNMSDEDKCQYTIELLDVYDSAFWEYFIDNKKVAEQIVDIDGEANTLATYDGEEIFLGNNLFAYRIN